MFDLESYKKKNYFLLLIKFNHKIIYKGCFNDKYCKTNYK